MTIKLPIQFFKYRKLYSHGYTEWNYDILPNQYGNTEEHLEEFIQENLLTEHDKFFSESYRYFEFEFIDLPPKEWLEQQIQYMTLKRDILNIQIEQFNNLLL